MQGFAEQRTFINCRLFPSFTLLVTSYVNATSNESCRHNANVKVVFELVDGCRIIIESLLFQILTANPLCHRFSIRFLSVWLGLNITKLVPYPVPPYTTSSFHLPLSTSNSNRTMWLSSLLVTSSKLKRDLDTLIKVAWIVLGDHSTSWVGIGSQWLWLVHWFVANDQGWSGSVQ